MGKKNCEEYKTLMMGLMDNELSAEESIRVNDHLIRCGSCREEYKLLKKTTAELSGLNINEPDPETEQKAWKSPYSRLTKNFGIALVIFGWVIMMIYGAYEFLVTKNTESIPKFAFVIIAVGFIILFITVLRDRIRSYRTDAYKEVDK